MAETSYYVQRGDKKFGPYKRSQLQSAAMSGKIRPDDIILYGEKSVKASRVKGLLTDEIPTPPKPPARPTNAGHNSGRDTESARVPNCESETRQAFVVDTSASPDARNERATLTYRVIRKGKSSKPLTGKQVRQLAQKGKLNGDDVIVQIATGEQTRAGDISQLLATDSDPQSEDAPSVDDGQSALPVINVSKPPSTTSNGANRCEDCGKRMTLLNRAGPICTECHRNLGMILRVPRKEKRLEIYKKRNYEPGGAAKTSGRPATSVVTPSELPAIDVDKPHKPSVSVPAKKKAQLPSESLPAAGHRQKAHGDGYDLTIAKKYVPSGKCGKPWIIALIVPLAPVASYIGVVVGGLIGAVAGFILVGIPGMLLDMFLGGVIQEATGGLSVRNVGANFGAAIGGIAGLGGGIYLTTKSLSRLSHNRSPSVAAILGSIASVLTLSPYFIFAQEAQAAIPGEYQHLASCYWLSVAGLVLGALFAVIASWESVKTTAYCENCFSYLTVTHQSLYAENGTKIMEIAKQGSKETFQTLKKSKSKKEYTSVSLETCNEQCCAYLEIAYNWETGDEGSKEHEVHREIKAEGFLNPQRANIWTEILTPVESKE